MPSWLDPECNYDVDWLEEYYDARDPMFDDQFIQDNFDMQDSQGEEYQYDAHMDDWMLSLF